MTVVFIDFTGLLGRFNHGFGTVFHAAAWIEKFKFFTAICAFKPLGQAVPLSPEVCCRSAR